MNRYLLLSLGGVAGTLARATVSARLPAPPPGFPWATFAVNLSSCFAIGLVDSLAGARSALSPEARLLLATGFCGAYSTFSTMILETSGLIGAGAYAAACANWVLSGLLGLALLRLGLFVGSLV